MLRKTLVFGALLGYYTSNQIKSVQHKDNIDDYDEALLEQQEDEFGTQPFAIEELYQQMGGDEDVFNELFDSQEVQVQEDVQQGGFKPQNCSSGIVRFTNGTSNTLKTYMTAKAGSAKWEDPEFGAEISSLTWSSFGYKTYSSSYSRYVWKRPAEMGEGLSANPSLWGKFGKPIPNGVKQAGLGDCWFLAAVSAIAEEPSRVYRFIDNKDYDANGAFRFYFWVKDGWYGVNIDDRLPSRSWGHGFRPFATNPSRAGAWWMPLLEKAYAKLDQNYDRIVGGNGVEGLRTLTGMPSIQLGQSASLEARLYPVHKYFSQMNFPATTSCCRNGGGYGLITGHAYSFLDVAELKDAAGNVKHVIAKVRNPWNVERYTGPFKDKDPIWKENPEWAKAVNLTDANDGIFWMPYKTFVTLFRKIDVALYQPYKYEVANLLAKKREYVYKFTNTKEQYLYVTAEMYSSRNFPRDSKCNPRNSVVLYLTDSKGTSVDLFSRYGYLGRFGFTTRGKLKDKLPKGDYKLRVLNYNYRSKAADIALNFYYTEEKVIKFNSTNGLPIIPPYKGPKGIKMTSTPGARDYATCNGVYHQVNKKAFGDWYNTKGNRAIFYCPRYKVWACSGRHWCKSKNDCSNIARTCGAFQHSGRSYEGDLSKVNWKGHVITAI